MAPQGRVPDFIIGGAPRSGTTALCHSLDNHPEVWLIKPYIPEPKVFVGYPEGTDFLALYDKFLADAPQGRLLGEKTSTYLENDRARRLIARYLPRVKLLFIVREPVARAYSNYRWSVKNGLEKLPFEEAIELEGCRPNPLGPEPERTPPFDYLRRSDYAALAEPYLETFGRDRVAFFLFEDLRLDPERLFGAVQEFLGLDPLPAQRLGVIRPDYNLAPGPAIDPRTEARLRERFKPMVERFAQMTGLDVSPWGY